MKRKSNLEIGSTLRERERERESILSSEQIGAKGGIREQQGLVLIPRDLK